MKTKPKPTDEEIAREAREIARRKLASLFGEWYQNGKLSYLYKSQEDLEPVLSIFFPAIKKAKE